MKKKFSFVLIILVLSPFYTVLSISATSTTTPYTPISHTIAIGRTQYGSYNTTEIDVLKNTNYTIIFTNQQSVTSDLTILKQGVVVNGGNCTNISSQFYALQLGPISNANTSSTVTGTWTSPGSDTWIMYYNSNDSGCGGAATLNLIKVGTPTTQSQPTTSQVEPGFESGIFLLTVIGLVILRIRNKKN